jgi:hypothetical protein
MTRGQASSPPDGSRPFERCALHEDGVENASPRAVRFRSHAFGGQRWGMVLSALLAARAV